MRGGDRGRRQTERALSPPPDDVRPAVRDAAAGRRPRSGLAATGRARAAPRARRGAAHAVALRARPRRRHERVQPSLPHRPAARAVDPASARPATAAEADGGARAPARDLWPADRSAASSSDRAGDRSRLRRAGADARVDRLDVAGAAPPARPCDASRARRSFGSAARSTSRGSARSRSRRSRRGSSASEVWGHGRSGSSRSKDSVAGDTGSSATSASSSCARPSAAGGSSSTRPRSCWSHTASGRGSPART